MSLNGHRKYCQQVMRWKYHNTIQLTMEPSFPKKRDIALRGNIPYLYYPCQLIFLIQFSLFYQTTNITSY